LHPLTNIATVTLLQAVIHVSLNEKESSRNPEGVKKKKNMQEEAAEVAVVAAAVVMRMFTILGAVSELGKSLIAERVRMGVQHARRKGVRLGRPPLRTLSSSELEKVRRDRATGKFSLRALAKKYGTSVWAAQQIVARMNLTV